MLFNRDIKAIYKTDNRQMRLDQVKNTKLQRFMDARKRYYDSLIIELKILENRKIELINAYVENVKIINKDIQYEKNIVNRDK